MTLMDKKQTGFMHLWLLAIITLLIVSAAGIYVYAAKSSKKSTGSFNIARSSSTVAAPSHNTSQTNSVSLPKSSSSTTSPSTPSTQSSAQSSPTTKTINISMYIDYQSPFSISYYSITQQVIATFGSRVIISYKDFPLVALHTNAQAASQAAEAANLQGALSGMQNLLLNNQSAWSA